MTNKPVWAERAERQARLHVAAPKLRTAAETARRTRVTPDNYVQVLQHVVDQLGELSDALADAIENRRL